MTDDQKAISLILDLLHASKGVPRALPWIVTEIRLAGRFYEVSTLLETMEEAGLISSEKDALHVRRYSITDAGRSVLANL